MAYESLSCFNRLLGWDLNSIKSFLIVCAEIIWIYKIFSCWCGILKLVLTNMTRFRVLGTSKHQSHLILKHHVVCRCGILVKNVNRSLLNKVKILNNKLLLIASMSWLFIIIIIGLLVIILLQYWHLWHFWYSAYLFNLRNFCFNFDLRDLFWLRRIIIKFYLFFKQLFRL